MKRLSQIVIFVLICTVQPFDLVAQGITGMGLKFGLNRSTFRTEDADELDLQSKSGLAAGGFITYGFGSSFFLQPELLYTQKGVKSETEEQGVPVDISIKLDYLELPFLAKFVFPTNSSWKPSIFAGPALAFNLVSKLKAEAQGFSAKQDLEDVSTFDLGFGFGWRSGISVCHRSSIA